MIDKNQSLIKSQSVQTTERSGDKSERLLEKCYSNAMSTRRSLICSLSLYHQICSDEGTVFSPSAGALATVQAAGVRTASVTASARSLHTPRTRGEEDRRRQRSSSTRSEDVPLSTSAECLSFSPLLRSNKALRPRFVLADLFSLLPVLVITS